MLPSPSGMGSATLKKSFSKLNHPAHRCPCLRFNCHLAMAAARLRVRMDSLLLSCRALSSPTTCRFNPAHPQVGLEPTTLRLTAGSKSPCRDLPRLDVRC